jgi:Tfp pilus assembly protein PilO
VISLPYDRQRVLRWLFTALGVAVVLWYARVYRPVSSSAAEAARTLAEREERVRSAEAATDALGPAGMDSLLAALRADSIRLARRVPAAAEAGQVAAELKEVLAQAERRAGVRVTATEPLPASVEGPFTTGGYVVRLAGTYAGIRALLGELAAVDRLTGVRQLRLKAVPDSLVGSAAPFGPDSAPADADEDEPAARLAAAQEAPWTAVATFHLVWYSLPPDTAPDASPEVEP